MPSIFRSHRVPIILTAAATVFFALKPFNHPTVYASSKKGREAGAVVFHEKGCEHCHGVDGVGTDRGPDLSGVGRKWHKDRIEQQIRNGGGGMPPFGDALHPDEIKVLVDFLSAKRKPSHAVRKPQPPAPAKPSSDDSNL